MERRHLVSPFAVSLAIALLCCGCEAEKGQQSHRAGGDADADADTSPDATAGPNSDSSADTQTDTQMDSAVSPGNGCDAVDILFVIDNSGSMTAEQENLQKNFPQFIELLESYKTPNNTKVAFRVGVTTSGVTRNYWAVSPPFPKSKASTVGQDGVLQGAALCSLDPPWIDGPAPDVSKKFTCATSLGVGGTTPEMPLAAMRDALEKQSAAGQPNEGFYRKGENSLLVVIIITDEEDCSIEDGGLMSQGLLASADCEDANSKGLYDTQLTKEFLDALTGGEGRYVVVGIAGPGPGQCSSKFGNALEAKRLKRFVEACGDHGVFGNICSGDLWFTLQLALETITLTCDTIPPLV